MYSKVLMNSYSHQPSPKQALKGKSITIPLQGPPLVKHDLFGWYISLGLKHEINSTGYLFFVVLKLHQS